MVAVVGGSIVYFRCSRPAAPTKPVSTMTKEEKARRQSFWTFFSEGQTLRQEGRWEEAIPKYRQALEVDPRHENALYYLATCHIELDRYEEALVPLKALIKAAPLSQRGHTLIGLVHSCPKAGTSFDLEAAEKALRRAFDMNPEESGSLLRLAAVELVKGNQEHAVEFYSLANQSNFRAVEGYYLRSYVRYKQDRLDEATDLLREAVQQSRKPLVVAEVAGEGDTLPGIKLPPSTLAEKQLIGPFWTGLEKRFPKGEIDSKSLGAEFVELEKSLGELRRRIASRPR